MLRRAPRATLVMLQRRTALWARGHRLRGVLRFGQRVIPGLPRSLPCGNLLSDPAGPLLGDQALSRLS